MSHDEQNKNESKEREKADQRVPYEPPKVQSLKLSDEAAESLT